ncbi:hypothetical protein DA718_03810 [Klebsiella huaxiensis]|nr:hypothetical protein DA718_03810 [Klebsiella huaxiensis]
MHLSGLPSVDCGEPVARAGALRRPREQSAERQNFPEAMLRICPGYRPAGSSVSCVISAPAL